MSKDSRLTTRHNKLERKLALRHLPAWSMCTLATALSTSSVTSSMLYMHFRITSSRPIFRNARSNSLPTTNQQVSLILKHEETVRNRKTEKLTAEYDSNSNF